MDTRRGEIIPTKKMIAEHKTHLRKLCILFTIWFTVTSAAIVFAGKSFPTPYI